MSEIVWIASYESASKAEARARAAGWKGDEDEVGMLDYIDVHGGDDNIQRMFQTKDSALEWLKAEINEKKSLFGCGDLDKMKRLGPKERCKYCVCNGLRRMESFIVDDEGISEKRDLSDDCWNGDDA